VQTAQSLSIQAGGSAYQAGLERVPGTLARSLFAGDDWAVSEHSAIAAALDAVSPNTRIAWRCDWAVFRAWAAGPAAQHFPDERLRLRLPVLPDVLVAFVRDMRRGIDESCQPRSIATIRRYLSTLGALHRMLSIPDPTKSYAVTNALKAAGRGSGDQRQAAPLRWTEIQSLLTILPDTMTGLRDKALLAVGHDTMARRSELVALDVGDVRWRETDALIALHPSKTDPEARTHYRYLGPDATRALRAWLSASALRQGPLFTAISRWGRVAADTDTGDAGPTESRARGRRLTALHVNEIIKAAAAALAEASGELVLPTRYAQRRKAIRAYAKAYSGHSLRVGAAQDLAAAGISTAAILVAGGWSDERMVKRYIREITALEGGMAQFYGHLEREPPGHERK
jgi:integrase